MKHGFRVDSPDEYNGILGRALEQLGLMLPSQYSEDAVSAGDDFTIALDLALQTGRTSVHSNRLVPHSVFVEWMKDLAGTLDVISSASDTLYIHLRMDIAWLQVLSENVDGQTAFARFNLLINDETIVLLERIKAEYQRLIAG